MRRWFSEKDICICFRATIFDITLVCVAEIGQANDNSTSGNEFTVLTKDANPVLKASLSKNYSRGAGWMIVHIRLEERSYV